MKSIKKITAFMLTSAIIIGCLMGEIITAKANSKNSFKYINLNDGRATVGNITFELKHKGTIGTESEYGIIYYTAKGKTKVLYKDRAGYVHNSLVSDGRTVYYVKKNNSVRCYNLQNGKEKKIFSEIDLMDIAGVGYGKLYYNLEDLTSFKSYDLKTGKRKLVLSDVGAAESFGRYIYCRPEESDSSPYQLRVYDMKTKKKKTISNETIIHRIISGKLYYVTCKNYNMYTANPVGTYSVYKSNLNGSGKKRLYKKKIKGLVYDLSKHSLTYGTFEADDYVEHTIKF